MPDPVPGAAGAATAPAAGQEAAAADDARFSEALARVLPTALARHLPGLLESHLAPFKAAAAPAVVAPKAPATAAAPGSVEAQLEEMRATLRTEQEGRAAERRGLAEARALGDLKTELGKAGIKAEVVDDVADLLFHARKVVTVAQDGHVTFKLGAEQYPSLAEGVAAWSRTPGAGLYKAPPGYGPGGAKRPTTPGARPPARPAAPGAAPGTGPRPDPLTKTLQDLGLG